MAGKSPAEALEAFINPIRETIQCVAETDVFGSSADERVPGSVTFTPRGMPPGNMIPVESSDRRSGDLLLGIYLEYIIVPYPDPASGPYKVSASYYNYGLYDHEEREITVFHWHPSGIGQTPFPHAHFSGARPIPLPSRHPNDPTPKPVDLSNAHIPTERMFIESFLLLLLNDQIVAPRRPDWQIILTRNLGAIQLSRTW